MASIHKRRLRSGETVWELTHGTGADRQRFVAGRTREEANEVLRQFERQLALHGRAPKDESVTAVVAQYVAYLNANRRYGTVRRYVRVLKTFSECFLSVYHADVQRLHQVRPSHVEEYKCLRVGRGVSEATNDDEAKREQDLRIVLARGVKGQSRRANAKFGWLGRKRLRSTVAQRTVNYELQVLRTFFHWAIRRNLLFINPVTAVERFRIPKRALPKFLTSEDLKKLFEACDEAERRLFMTIMLTGMRKGEAEHLQWSDVSFELGVIFIQEKPEVGWKPKTDERVIPMSSALRQILSQQRDHRTSDKWVFANEAGNVDTHLLGKLKNLCKRAGIRPANVHALRHSFGAHLRMAGVSLADIADLLGHKDLATTQIYAKVQQEHLRSMISKLGAVVGDVATEGEHDAPKDDAAGAISLPNDRKLLTE